MPDIKKVNIKGATYDVHDVIARADIQSIITRIEVLENKVGEGSVVGGTVIVSETEPEDPVEGTIWIMPIPLEESDSNSNSQE